MNPRELFIELKERKVLRLALIYVVVGWVVIQAADIILPELLLPEWSVRLVIVLVLLGFPVALVVSWFFDTTPDGVRRTRGRSRGRSGVRPRTARGRQDATEPEQLPV